MPDRVVRQGILSSDLVNTLTWPAEVFYRRLMSIADDYGRYEADIAILRAFLYPKKIDKVSEPDVVKWLGECSKAGLVRCYRIDGKQYLEILQFNQRLRAMKSKYPAPPSLADSRGQVSAERGHMSPETKRNESETESEKKGNEGGNTPAPAPPAPPSQEKGVKLKEKQADMLRRRKEFHAELQTFSGQYTPDLIAAFFKHWSEHNKSQTKMRFEMETTWVLSLRLSKWESNDYKWSKGKAGSSGAAPDRDATAEEVEYLYQRFLEGAKLKDIAKEKHCDFLLQAGLIQLDERFVQQAALWRAKQLVGTNDAGELRMIQAYENGTWPADTDCKRDEPNRLRIAKKLALIDYFQKSKALNRKNITDADEKS